MIKIKLLKCAWIQILDMKEIEVEQLAKHLGHDAKTHREFYRLSDTTVQLSKACVGSCYHFMLFTVFRDF